MNVYMETLREIADKLQQNTHRVCEAVVMESGEKKLRIGGIDVDIVVVPVLDGEIRKEAEQKGINVVDKQGNCCIRTEQLVMDIRGIAAERPARKHRERLNKAGLKVVLYLLGDKMAIKQPMRKIQQTCGVSLGSVQQTLELLTQRKFVMESSTGRRLCRVQELRDWWQQQYNDGLKPRLFVRRMAFVRDEARLKWMDLTLPEGWCWGSDPAAFLLDGYLRPGKWTLYGDKTMAALLQTGRLIPQEDGEVWIYERWWEGELTDEAYRMLVYADLMGERDDRCVEAAKRLYNME